MLSPVSSSHQSPFCSMAKMISVNVLPGILFSPQMMRFAKSWQAITHTHTHWNQNMLATIPLMPHLIFFYLAPSSISILPGTSQPDFSLFSMQQILRLLSIPPTQASFGLDALLHQAPNHHLLPIKPLTHCCHIHYNDNQNVLFWYCIKL